MGVVVDRRSVPAHCYTAINHLPLDIHQRGQGARQLLKPLLVPHQKVREVVHEQGFKCTPDGIVEEHQYTGLVLTSCVCQLAPLFVCQFSQKAPACFRMVKADALASCKLRSLSHRRIHRRDLDKKMGRDLHVEIWSRRGGFWHWRSLQANALHKDPPHQFIDCASVRVIIEVL
jgi:hypothetical protein